MPNFLIIFEDKIISKDTLFCALQLAQRMEGNLYILMLNHEQESRQQEDFQRGVTAMLEGFSLDKLASIQVRHGDKPSELLKYLALAPSFHTVLWGGDGSILKEARRGKKEHWFIKVAKGIGCPIVTPLSKRIVLDKK
jgi:hypothetical protein